MVRDPSWFDLLIFLALAGFIGIQTVRNHFSSPQSPVEQAREAYVRGEIDEKEFARRVEFEIDDRNEQIRALVEDVRGVGPETSKAIAEKFDSLEELHDADRDTLEDVHGVGEGTADAVLERVR